MFACQKCGQPTPASQGTTVRDEDGALLTVCMTCRREMEGKMNGIGWAVKQMQDGQKVTRASWNAPGQWIALEPLGATLNLGISEPFVYLKNAQDRYIPWQASQGDLLAMDWEIAED